MYFIKIKFAIVKYYFVNWMHFFFQIHIRLTEGLLGLSEVYIGVTARTFSDPDFENYY